MQIFPEFQIPQAKISRIAEPGFPQCSVGYRYTTVVQYMLIDLCGRERIVQFRVRYDR